MAPNNGKKTTPVVTEDDSKPLPPNIFLYIQLANIQFLPMTIHPLEIHLEQGDSLIVKCVEQYNTEGIILQDEFLEKPTYTLIFQQDNLDRINQAADNPLIIKLYMRSSEPIVGIEEEENLEEGEEVEVNQLLKSILGKVEGQSSDEVNYYEEKGELVLLCVGYLDIIKLFSHQRCLIHEELSLYPVPDVPNELRVTVLSEWHLYTLLPIAKAVTFTNLTFVTFESIYNLKDDYMLNLPTLRAELSFRSVMPNAKNVYHVIPWCNFKNFYESIIAEQKTAQMFESFRASVPFRYCTGLKSNIDTQMHNLFQRLMCSENLEINFANIDPKQDTALVCNTFHRYLLTSGMSDIIFNAIASRRYLITVDIWQTTIIEKKVGKNIVKETGDQKVFEGILDSSILLYPDVQRIRFAVELKYTGTKAKTPKPKRMTVKSITELNPTSSRIEFDMPTFAIIRVCSFAPLGQVYQELKNFRESFISQNRFINCKIPNKEPKITNLYHLQNEAYSRFDTFIRDTIRYVFVKNIHSVADNQNHFCCALQNLTNILLKVVGSDFNMRERTKTNLQFANLCAVAFNELQLRIHKILEKLEHDDLEELAVNTEKKAENLIDFGNSIKLMGAVGDKHMETVLNDMTNSNFHDAAFDFFKVIVQMERGNYANAREFFKSKSQLLSPINEYCAGWIRIYLNYLDTRDDPDPVTAARANECLLNSISQYAESHERQLDGWILLYCYYKRFDYPPGCNYARWRMQSQAQCRKQILLPAPYSMWGISLNCLPVFETARGNQFFGSFRIFVRLGLYEFGQVVFDEIQHLCSKEDAYMITTQLKIQLKTLEEDFEFIDFQRKESTVSIQSVSNQGPQGFMAQLFGNVEYYRGNLENAMKYYKVNIHNTEIDSNAMSTLARDLFLLSKLRYAYMSFNAGLYEQAIDALNFQYAGKILTLSMNYLMGKAYYRLENYSKALECFSDCTKNGTHMPDAWGYLALINLQMGNNMIAINCWKYAKIDPTKTISDETIFAELDMIDMDSVELYVDVPDAIIDPSTTDED